MAPITINGNLVDLDSNHPKNVAFSKESSAAGSDYILVQTKDSLNKRELAELREVGATLQEYVAHNTYLFYYKPEDLQPIREKSFVDKAGVYAKGLKINGHLQSSSNVSPKDTRTVYAVLHKKKDGDVSRIVSSLAEAGGVSENKISVDGNKVKLEVDPTNRRSSEETYQGEGQIVAVADTGLDKGDKDDVHPAFKGRVKALIPVGRLNETDDEDGHGTHVCGSILGGPISIPSEGVVQGMAPKAELVLQSLADDDGGLFPKEKDGPYSLTKLFVGPHKKFNACIHSNSWGAKWTGKQLPYDDATKEIDQCMWDNPDLLICFAAGNEGDKTPLPTIGFEASAKNCLTIGASESTRPSYNMAYTPGKKTRNDSTEVAFYSSRGPTLEGRIKPDVVAPGTAILSAKSRGLSKKAKENADDFGKSPDPDLVMFDTGTSMATPLVAGCAAVLREVLVKNGTPRPSGALIEALLINGAFTLHHAHGGKEGFGRVCLQNSVIIPKVDKNADFVMGTPLEDRGEEKTFTVTIPRNLGAEMGEKNGESSDDDDEGNDKKVDNAKMHESTKDTATDKKAAKEVVNKKEKDSSEAATLRVSPPPIGKGVTLKVTLAYTDSPAAKLQNNLNLVVTSSDGAERHGNMGTSENYDQYNNVEQIVWKGIAPRKADIKVQANRILTDRQDYALVWRIIPSEE